MSLTRLGIGKVLFGMLAPALLGMATGPESAGAVSPEVDKSTFNLLIPTPKEHLRGMDADYPGSTESPYTVDAGHFQVELRWVGYSLDRESFNGVTQRTEEWSIVPMDLKLGLLNQMDVQLLLAPYTVLQESEGGNHVTRRGFGDTTVRVKYNFWGNDDGRTAFAATPFIKFPTSHEGIGNRGVEGGLVLPLAIELPQAFYLGLTTRFDAARDEDQSGYHTEFTNSIELGHDLFGSLYGWVEFASEVSTERNADWEGIFNTGLVHGLTENLQLSTGVNIGVTRPADDWYLFAGMAWRF
jgi:hypothetical protein